MSYRKGGPKATASAALPVPVLTEWLWCAYARVSQSSGHVESSVSLILLSSLPPTLPPPFNDAITTQEGWSLNSIHDEQRELQDDDDKLLEDIHIIPDYPSTRLLEVKKKLLEIHHITIPCVKTMGCFIVLFAPTTQATGAPLHGGNSVAFS